MCNIFVCGLLVQLGFYGYLIEYLICELLSKYIMYVLLGPAEYSEDEDITPTYMTKDNGGHLLG